MLLAGISLAIFRFFFGRSDDTTSGEASREILDPALCRSSSFFLLVPAATGLVVGNGGMVGRVTVTEDPPETLEDVDAAEVRLWRAVVNVVRISTTPTLTKTHIFDAT